MKFSITDGEVNWRGEETQTGSVSYKPSTKTVTVLNREDTQIRVNKVWAGEDEKASPVTMKLYRTSLPVKLKTVPYRDNQTVFGNITYPIGATITAYFVNENGGSQTQTFVTTGNESQIHIGQNNISNVRLEISLPTDVESSKRLVVTKSTLNNTVLFDGLDRADPAGNLYTYWVEEETPAGRYTVKYDGNYVTHNSLSKEITVTNTPEEEIEGLIEVEKVWKDADGETISDTSELPEITVKLKATAPSGDAVIHCIPNGGSEKCAILTYTDGSKIQLGDTIRLSYNQGEVKQNGIHKESIGGATIPFTKDETTGWKEQFKVTSTEVYAVFNWLNDSSVSAVLVSRGSDSQDTPPDDITITLNNGNNYYWSSADHPGALDTENYAYKVDEESVPTGYEVSYSTNNEKGVIKGKLVVTNTRTTPRPGARA